MRGEHRVQEGRAKIMILFGQKIFFIAFLTIVCLYCIPCFALYHIQSFVFQVKLRGTVRVNLTSFPSIQLK